MTKFIVKFLAKKLINKHKNDSVFMGMTDKTIQGYDLVGDMFLYVFLWGLGLFLFIFGLPILFYFIWGIWASIFTFFFCVLIGAITTAVVGYNVIGGLYKEILETLDLIRKGHESIQIQFM